MQNLKILQQKLGKPYYDLEFLLEILKEVLIENGEVDMADNIPWINPPENYTKKHFTSRHFHLFSISFQLVNLVEINGAVQTRRKHEDKESLAAVNGLWAQNFELLKRKNIDPEIIASYFDRISVQPVLTAHPTEAKRPVVLKHYRELYLLLVRRENTTYNTYELDDIRKEMKGIINRLWYIGEIFLEKPNVESELDNVIHYLVNVFPTVLPVLHNRLEQAWKNAGFDLSLISDVTHRPSLRFGNWVGGDRDGHPLVTPDVTKFTLQKLRLESFILIKKELVELAENLSIYIDIEHLSKPLQLRIDQMVAEDSKGLELKQNYAKEGYKAMVNLMVRKIPVNIGRDQSFELKERKESYQRSFELIEDLKLLSTALKNQGIGSVATSLINNTVLLVQTFGFHLATLDIRQNSKFNESAFVQLIESSEGQGNQFKSMTDQKKLDFLKTELTINRPFVREWSQSGPEAVSVIGCFDVLEKHIHQYGEGALGSIIVSMTRGINDLLIVYLLAREAGLTFFQNQGIICKLPVVPLFETIEDLNRSAEILDQYFGNEVVINSLKYQRDRNKTRDLIQDVMIGYSDSNKDGGILSSYWCLMDGQENMCKVALKYGVKLRFFHGKGGTISRGAGPFHWFLKTLPHQTINGLFKITEQGETIEKKYANKINAAYNLELLMAGVTTQTILHENRAVPQDDSKEILEFMANESHRVYNELLNNPCFIPFYSEATPIDVIEQSKIGSRPSRRTGARTFEDLRAIPWVFSWGQARFHLTSWYGVGTTINKMKNQFPEKYDLLKCLIPVNPHIRYILTNVDTSLASTDENIMIAYANLVSDKNCKEQILPKLLDELTLTRKMLNDLIEIPMEKRRKNHFYSTLLRAEALSALHIEQIRLLKIWRRNPDDEKGESLMNLLSSVNAIANAMGTTG